MITRDRQAGGGSGDIKRWQGLVFLLVMTITTLILVFGKLAYDGKEYIYADVGSDTAESYLPTYVSFADNLFNGKNDIWVAEYGLGNTIYSKSASVMEPILMLVLMITSLVGTAHISTMLIVYKCLTVIGAAIICYFFLNMFSEHYLPSALVAYIYAFNGFSIVWGQHYFFSCYGLYAILVIFAVEKYIRSEKNGPSVFLIFASFLCMLYTAYLTYMIYLTMIAYSLIRYFSINKKTSFSKFLVKFFNLGLNIVIGFLLSMFAAYPAINVLMGSGRVGQDTSAIGLLIQNLKVWTPIKSVPAVLQRFLSSNYMGIDSEYIALDGVGGNFYEAIHLFFSVFVLVFLIQYIYQEILKGDNTKNRILCLVSILLFLFCIFNDGAKFILYAFSGAVNRVSFVLFPFIAIACAMALDKLLYQKVFSLVLFVISFVGSVYLLIWTETYRQYGNLLFELKRMIPINIAAFAAGCIVLLIMIYWKPKYFLFGIFALTVMLNITAEMYYSTDRKGNITTEHQKIIFSEDNQTKAAIDYIKSLDDEYYRLDKAYKSYSYYTDSLLYDYRSVSDYNSASGSGLKKYYVNFFDSNYTLEGTDTGIVTTFIMSPYDIIPYSQLNLRYILTIAPLFDDEHYELLKEMDGVYIYRNKYADSFLNVYDRAVDITQFLNSNYFERNRVLADSVVISDEDLDEFKDYSVDMVSIIDNYEQRDISDIMDYDTVESESGQEVQSVTLKFKENWDKTLEGDAYVEFEVMSDASGVLTFTLGHKDRDDKQTQGINVTGGLKKSVRYLIPDNTTDITLSMSGNGFVMDQLHLYDTLTPVITDNCSSHIYPCESKSGILEGDFTVKKDGIMLIPIPYDKSVKIEVDDTEQKVYKVNSGLAAVKVKTGDHNIYAYYDNIDGRKGLIMTVVAAIGLLIYVLIYRRRGDKKIDN